MDNTTTTTATEPQGATKFCKHCGQKVMEAAVICPHCGCQIEEVKKSEQPNIVINNSNANMNTNTNINGGRVGKPKNKWVALLLCFFFGYGNFVFMKDIHTHTIKLYRIIFHNF